MARVEKKILICFSIPKNSANRQGGAVVRNKIFFPVMFWVRFYVSVPRYSERHTARVNINGLYPVSAGDREMRILEERKRKMVVRSVGWNWMATFCRVHFVRGSMVVCMDVTSTEVRALYASSSKTPQDRPSSNKHVLVLQLYC